MYLISQALPNAYVELDWDEKEKWTYGRLIINLGNGYSRVYDPWAGIHSTIKLLNIAIKDVEEGIKEGEIGEIVPSVREITDTIVNFGMQRKHPALTAVDAIRGKRFF